MRPGVLTMFGFRWTDGCFLDKEKKILREKPLEYLDRCIGWCADYGLHAVIDLHNIEGHVYGQMEIPTP